MSPSRSRRNALRAARPSTPSTGERVLSIPTLLAVAVAAAVQPAMAADAAWQWVAPPATLCAGEAMWEEATIAPPERVCAADFNILPEEVSRTAGADQGPALRHALEHLAQRQASLFLPSGTYAFNGDLTLPGGTGLVGSPTGHTRLKHLGSHAARLSTDAGATRGILIQGLQLINTRIILDSRAASEVRGNGLAGTQDPAAQITVVRGAHVIQGNVLRRARHERGFGIDIGVKNEFDGHIGIVRPSAPAIRVVGNLIGAVDPSREVRGFRPRGGPILEMARVMLRALPEGHESKGHYVTALRSMIPVPVSIVRNRVTLNELDEGRAAGLQATAEFFSPRHLLMQKNFFDNVGFETDKGPPVFVFSPSDVLIRENAISRSPLILARHDGESSPIKRTVISDILMNGASIRVGIPVNGAGDQHTGAQDLQVFGNSFLGLDTCAIRLPKPAAGESNFEQRANHSESGSLACTR